MRQHQVALQLRGFIGRNARIGQFAEAGIDTVDRFVAPGRFGDDFGRGRIDALAAGFVDAYRTIATVYPAQIAESGFAGYQCQSLGSCLFRQRIEGSTIIRPMRVSSCVPALVDDLVTAHVHVTHRGWSLPEKIQLSINSSSRRPYRRGCVVSSTTKSAR